MSFESLVLILGAESQRAREVAPGHSRLSCAFLTSPMGLQRSQEAVLLGLARASVPNSLQVERGEPVWTWDAEALRVRELHLAVRLGLENSPGVEGAVGRFCVSLGQSSALFAIPLPFSWEGSALFYPLLLAD